MKKFVKINAIIIAAGFVLFLIGTVWLSAAGAKYFSGKTVSYEENLSLKLKPALLKWKLLQEAK